jgi:hypothetical protein
VIVCLPKFDVKTKVSFAAPAGQEAARGAAQNIVPVDPTTTLLPDAPEFSAGSMALAVNV